MSSYPEKGLLYFIEFNNGDMAVNVPVDGDGAPLLYDSEAVLGSWPAAVRVCTSAQSLPVPWRCGPPLLQHCAP